MTAAADLDLLRTSFIPETRDLLEVANEALLALEARPDDTEAINRLFRAVHTIKGTAGIFDLPTLVHLVHAAEDLLGAIRDGRLALAPAMTDDLLGGFDHVGRWIEALDQSGAIPADSGAVARERGARYRDHLRALEPSSDASAPGPVGAAAPAAEWPDWLDGALQAVLRRAAMAAGVLDGELVALVYEPERECFFRGEDPLYLVRQLPELISLEVEAREPWPSAADLDPYACVLRFTALSRAPRATIEHLMRYNLGETRIAALSATRLLGSSVASLPTGQSPIFTTLPAMFLEVLSTQARILEIGQSGFRERLPAVRATVLNALASAGVIVRGSELSDMLDLVEQSRSADPLRTWIAGIAARGRGAGPSDGAGAGEADRRGERSATVERQDRSTERILKVEQRKVDLMMTLVGELVVAKNALPFLARRAEHDFGSRELAREVKDQYAVIDRITQDMQAAVMGIRMLPVSEMVKRFPRLVRDISRKLGKTVDLVVEGESTEADKNVIEALSDPLLHIVRNSLDHGLETPQERLNVGKPANATLRIGAYQEGDNVVIEIADDGRGIDPRRVTTKALAKGLIDADRAARLTDHEAIQLVFYPGFSTVEQASDLSGRGVGMDVVRSTVEGLGGAVTLTSECGKGTTVRLCLPLSMAVTRVMTVQVEGQLFGVPMDLVVETVRAPRERIQRLKRAETMTLRDAVIPLVRLRKLLAMPLDPRPEEAVLVVRVAGVPIGLVIDDFRTGMDVILKPMTGILAGMPGYSGSAVLGDGKVLLVLNLKGLL